MRKRLLDKEQNENSSFEPEWLDIDRIAVVELTSEDPDYPIEHALIRGSEGEWRASGPGEQIIRLIFDDTQKIRQMSLMFAESQCPRTQQFEIAYTTGEPPQLEHFVRQQWNFTPENGSNTELEIYECSMDDVSMLELRIIPDIGGGSVRASMQEWKIAK